MIIEFKDAIYARKPRLRRWGSAVAPALVALSLMGGCSGEADLAVEDTTATQQEPLVDWLNNGATGCAVDLTGWADFAIGSTIDLCFTGPASAADRTLAQTAVNDSWGSAANLVLRWRGTCPASIDPNWVSIYLHRGNDSTGDGAPGLGSRLKTDCPGSRTLPDGSVISWNNADRWERRSDVQMEVMVLTTESDGWFQAVVVHEFGHVLGFSHEMDRFDSNHNTALCDAETGSVSAGLLTEYDPQSIMSYCSSQYGRPHDDWQLTSRDRLGAEMKFPHSLTSHSLGCNSGCVTTGTGGAIVRSDGSLTSDWTARGALNIVPTWTRYSPYWTGSGETLSAADLNTMGNVLYSFTDVEGRTNTGAGYAVKSNSLHAAVLQAAASGL